jgi:Na+/proline symporter
MSTVSSLLVMAAGSITHDLYEKVYNPTLSDNDASRLCRRITIILALFSLGLAFTVSILSPDRTIFWFVIFGWAGIAATFCPMIILSLFWPRYTEKAAIASMLTGFSMTLICKFVIQGMEGIGPHFTALETMPPSFLSALIVGYLVTIMAPDKELETKYRAELRSLDDKQAHDATLVAGSLRNT